jgi:hypothetical protein
MQQQEAWVGFVGAALVCGVLPTNDEKWPWQMQGRSEMIGPVVSPARSFEEACWLAEVNVLGFIKSHGLVPAEPAKAAIVSDRSSSESDRIIEYWSWREASGWDDSIEPDVA